MKILKKAGHQLPTKLTERVSKLPTSELVIWTENALFAIGKNVAGVGAKTPEQYAEAVMGAEALYAITLELKKRATNG
jgi:hypothetical protein